MSRDLLTRTRLWASPRVRSDETNLHPCYGRLVIDVAGSVAGAYAVRYVPVGTFDGSSSPPLQGGAVLEVITRAAVSPADSFLVDSASLVDVNVDGYRTFRQIRWVGSFEGETTIALGVRARLPFRVFVLPGPGSASRLVVDVAHRW